MPLLISILTFVALSLATFALVYPSLRRREQVRTRIDKLMPRQETVSLIPIPARWQELLSGVGSKIKLKPLDLRIYRETVTAAGFRKELTSAFIGSKILLAVLMPALCLGFVIPRGVSEGGTLVIMLALCAIAGFLLPGLWLGMLARRRRREIFHAIPDVLDLLTVCVEAGLSLEAALLKTTENFDAHRCPLIQEINTALLEMRAGRPRPEALKGLAQRTTVEDLNGLVSMLVQTEKFGTSLGKTLRTYSDSLRTKRRQIAEEEAAKTGVKMLFPLTFCIFPALLVVMLVPAFYQMYFMFKSP